MRYFLVTAAHMGHGAEKVRHGPFSSRKATESAAIAALSTSKFARIEIEEDKEDEEDEDKEDEEDED